jgi:hypothetical protein
MLACGDNECGQCCVYSAERFVTSFQPVTAIDGGPHAERVKTLVCGRNWTVGQKLVFGFLLFFLEWGWVVVKNVQRQLL